MFLRNQKIQAQPGQIRKWLARASEPVFETSLGTLSLANRVRGKLESVEFPEPVAQEILHVSCDKDGGVLVSLDGDNLYGHSEGEVQERFCTDEKHSTLHRFAENTGSNIVLSCDEFRHYQYAYDVEWVTRQFGFTVVHTEGRKTPYFQRLFSFRVSVPIASQRVTVTVDEVSLSWTTCPVIVLGKTNEPTSFAVNEKNRWEWLHPHGCMPGIRKGTGG